MRPPVTETTGPSAAEASAQPNTSRKGKGRGAAQAGKRDWKKTHELASKDSGSIKIILPQRPIRRAALTGHVTPCERTNV